MAKYNVSFSCGHTARITLFGAEKGRADKIEYYEKYGKCPDCRKMEKFLKDTYGCKEVEMTYREYKDLYPECRTKEGSYNPKMKTIIVYVPDASATPRKEFIEEYRDE